MAISNILSKPIIENSNRTDLTLSTNLNSLHLRQDSLHNTIQNIKRLDRFLKNIGTYYWATNKWPTSSPKLPLSHTFGPDQFATCSYLVTL